ncbi:beta transducin [Gurleya vavrai]
MENLLPEFIYQSTIGEIINKQSKISKDKENTYVCINNTLNIYNTRSMEIKKEITDNKNYKISAFCIYKNNNEKLFVLGYENGIIKIFDEENNILNKFKAHRKRITEIIQKDFLLIISSINGTLIKYDIITEEIKFYNGSDKSIFNLKVFNDKIYANCSDNAIRIWNIKSEEIFDLVAFDEEIFLFDIFENFLFVFFISGNSVLFNLETKSLKKFNVYKNIRDIKIYEDKLLILENKKIYVFKINKKDEIALQSLETHKIDFDAYKFSISTEFMSFTTKNSIFTVSKKQKNLDFLSNIKKTVFHENLIFEVILHKEFIFSVSEEKFIVWRIVDNEILKIYSNVFDFKAVNATFLENYLIVGSKNKIFVFNPKNGDLIYSKEIKNSCIKSFNEFLFVGFENNLSIFRYNKYIDKNKSQNNIENNSQNNIENYSKNNIENYSKNNSKNYSKNNSKNNIENNSKININSISKNNLENNKDFNDKNNLYINNLNNKDFSFEKVYENEFDEHIVNIEISKDTLVYAISFLNNNVKLFDRKTNDQKIVLFGHSLPVKSMCFSPDNKLLLTCGADKLVKLWGTDFGECRKSFLGNTKNAEFITEDSFVYADNTIKYYKKHDLIKEFKGFDFSLLRYNKKFLIVALNYGLRIYRVGEYVFLKKEESSEEEEILLTENKIVNYKKFEKFVEELDSNNKEEILKLIKLMDFSEIDKLIFLLNAEQIKILIEIIGENFEKYPILMGKVFLYILKIHGYICEENEEIYKVYKKLSNEIDSARNEIGINFANLI